MRVMTQSHGIKIERATLVSKPDGFLMLISTDEKHINAEVIMSGLIQGVVITGVCISDADGPSAYIEIHDIPGYHLGVSVSRYGLEIVGIPEVDMSTAVAVELEELC
jgi:hypothetical protein